MGLYIYICAGPTEFLVTPPLMGTVCLLSQGQFEEPVRAWLTRLSTTYILQRGVRETLLERAVTADGSGGLNE